MHGVPVLERPLIFSSLASQENFSITKHPQSKEWPASLQLRIGTVTSTVLRNHKVYDVYLCQFSTLLTVPLFWWLETASQHAA